MTPSPFVEEVEQSQDRLLGVLRAMVGVSEVTEKGFVKRLGGGGHRQPPRRTGQGS